jgi:perosamine synthetase
MQPIAIAGPSITDREISYVTDAVTNAWYGGRGEYEERFERAFAEYVGVRHAMALPSCTSAIHLSLAALGVGRGDEVIVPDITWIASSAPISYVGAQPVFADIDPETWCLCPHSFARSISHRTRAVIVVDLYGNMPRMEAILSIARQRRIAVVEDAAEAFGSRCGGKMAGSFGDTGVFSFHGSKTMTTGEGGMLVTDHENIYRRALFLRDHGRMPGDTSFRNAEVAFKYRMSSLQAALGLAQVERAEELVARKREIFSWYQRELGDVSPLSLNPEFPGTCNSYWMVTALADARTGLGKEHLMAKLAQQGIDSRPFFYPLSSLPAYAATPAAQAAQQHNAVAYDISPRGVNLPCAMNITREQVAHIAATLRTILGP